MTEELKGIEVHQEDGKANIVLDMSMFDLFNVCPCRYNYRHNLRKAPPINEKSKPLDMGGLVHEGLEVYFKMLKDEVKSYDDRMQAVVNRINFVSSDPDLSNSEPEEVDTVIRAVTESCDYWRFEDEQLIIHEVEQSFAYILYEDNFVRIIITGKIDLLVDIPPLGRSSGYTNLPIDHKSFSRDFEVPRLSNQFMNYTSAVGSNYLIVNRVGLYAKSSKLKPEDKYKRVPISYDHLMLEDWKHNVTQTILDDYLNCLSSGNWKMRFTSCFAWNRKCEYYEICESSGPEAKAFKLESRFATVSPWDVTAKLTKSQD